MTAVQTMILRIYAAIIATWPIRYLVLSYILGQDAVPVARLAGWMRPDPPLVTAVIPAKDEESTLADCLASVCRPDISSASKSW